MKFPKLKLNYKKRSGSESIFGSEVLSSDFSLKKKSEWVDDFTAPSKNNNEANYVKTRISNIIDISIWRIFLISIVGFILIVAFRAFYLQIFSGESYKIIAEGNRIRSIPILPKRGLIYDSAGIEITTNLPLFLLTIHGADLPLLKEDRDEVFSQISKLGIPLSYEELKEELKKKPRLTVAELSYEEALIFMPVLQNLPGASVSLYERRNYLDPEIFSHIIGYLAPISDEEINSLTDNYLINDYLGKTGIESVYEIDLRGILGTKGVEVDSRGKEEKVAQITNPIDGLNIHLTIDKRLQKKAYELIENALKNKKNKRASFIVTDPQTGKILTLVSYPGYNNQAFYQGINSDEYQDILNNSDRPLFNRAISGQYPPGSTFKTVLATAGLELGLITPRTTFFSSGGIQVSRWFFPDWKAGGHGPTNIYKAISESVNTFFYILGGGYKDIQGLGSENIRRKALDFGLLNKTGIDLRGEAEGFFPTPDWKAEVKNEPWYIGDTYNLSIGQGDVLVTPIQMTMLTAAIANGGTLFKPHLIDHFSSRDGNLIYRDNDWVSKESVGDPSAVSVVKRAMRETVLTGSARSLLAVPSSVSGKTGTAQWSSIEEPHGWFIGFAPYDTPEIALTILVESSGGGGKIAVPIAKEFLTWYFTTYKETL